MTNGGQPASTVARRPATSGSGDDAIIRLRDVSVEIETPGGIVLPVEDIDLDIRRGRTLGLVGESGSGKSLLLRAVFGLLPRNARVLGSIELDGRELTTMAPRELRRLWATKLAIVFQDPMTSLDPLHKVGRQIIEPMKIHQTIQRSERRGRALRLLEELGITDPARCCDSYPHQLSGGMRQRVSIAMALACDPEILLADEPTTALDVTVQAQIIDLLRAEQRRRHASMVFVSHDLGVIGEIADDLAVMYGGQIVELGPAASVLSAPRMRYTEALLAGRPTLDGDRRRELATIPGRPPHPGEITSGCRFRPRCHAASAQCDDQPELVESAADRAVRCWNPCP